MTSAKQVTLRVKTMTMKAKCYLHRITLNSQGYTSSGNYFGIGQRLYWFSGMNDENAHCVRAANREAAKAKIRAAYPTVEFYR
jgi:hypothetical protein